MVVPERESMKNSEKSKSQLMQALDAADQRIAALEAQLAQARLAQSQSGSSLIKLDPTSRDSLLDLFLEYNRDPVAIFDTEMKYLAVSRHWLTDFGLGDQDIIGRSHYEVFPELPERWKKAHQQGLKGVSQKNPEDYFIGTDGQVHWTNWEIHPWHTESGDIGGIVLFSRVITDRKIAELALRESEQKLQALFEVLPAGVSVLDKQKRIIEMNKTLEKILDLTLPELLSGKYQERKYLRADETPMPPEEFPSARAVSEQRAIFDVEIGIVKEDGDTIWTSVSAAPLDIQDISVVIVTTDITPRKQTEGALQESEERFRQIAENVGELFFVRDLQSNQMLYASPIYDEIMGQPRQEIYDDARAWLRVVHPDDKVRVMNALEQQAKDGTLFDLEYRIIVDDEVRWLWGRTFPVNDEHGNRTRLVGIVENFTERKHNHEKLKYHAMLWENVSDAIISFDKQGRIMAWNKGAEQIYGWSADEAVGQDASDLLQTIYPGSADRAAVDAQMTEEGIWGGELSQVNKHGRRLRLLASACPLRDSNGNILGTISVNRDITARVQAEEAYRTLVEKSLQGLIILRSGRIEYANPRIAEISGYSVDELLAFTAEDVAGAVHPDDRDFVRQQFIDRFIVQNQPDAPLHLEFRQIHKDGSIRWVESIASTIDYDGNPAAQVVYVDIAERKLAENALIENEAYLRSLTNNLADVVFTVKMPERKVEYVNDTVAGIFGYAPGEIIGRTTRMFYPSDEAFKAYGEKLSDALSRGESLLRLEQQLVRKNGEQFWANISTAFMFTDGELTQVVSIVTDVSVHKEAEYVRLENERLRVALEKEKEHADLKDRFMSTIAHEIRTPLTTIIMSSATLKSHWEKINEADRRETLNRIIDQVTSLDQLLNEVSLGMRANRGYIEYLPVQTNLIELCKGILHKIEGLAKDRHELVFTHTGHLDMLYFDPQLLDHIIENLLSNAIKYSPEGGKITLALSRTEEDIIFRVTDEGIGITASDQKRLFTPYFRGKNVGAIRGTGIGLSIVQELVELHGGTVTYTSTPEVGSTFTVSIPIRQAGQ